MTLQNNQGLYNPFGADFEAGSFATLLHPGTLGQHVTINVGTSLAPIYVTYRLVKLKTGVTFAVGEVVYWEDRDDFIVTNVANGGQIAGFIPGGAAVTPAPTAVYTALHYAYIVIAGRRAVKGLDSMTVAAATTGLLVVGTATAGRVDCVTSDTGIGLLIAKACGRSASAQDGTSKLFLADINVFDQA